MDFCSSKLINSLFGYVFWVHDSHDPSTTNFFVFAFAKSWSIIKSWINKYIKRFFFFLNKKNKTWILWRTKFGRPKEAIILIANLDYLKISQLCIIIGNEMSLHTQSYACKSLLLCEQHYSIASFKVIFMKFKKRNKFFFFWLCFCSYLFIRLRWSWFWSLHFLWCWSICQS